MLKLKFLIFLSFSFSLVSVSSLSLLGRPTSANCTTSWFINTVDHFSPRIPPENNGSLNWYQRVLICSQYYTNPTTGVIFFYTGNEGDVTLYANNTGLMWENAASFNALLVFAEHRYYGQSWPLLNDSTTTLRHMEYLSSQQALADYAVLIRSIRLEYGDINIPVIAFGGSYGGVLSAMMRVKYPGTVDGAISASAPLRSFPGQVNTWNSEDYYARVTSDATSAGGSPDSCASNVRQMWTPFFADSKTSDGRARLSAAFNTCSPLQTEDDGLALAFWIRGAFDEAAMGNYPWPSDYICYPVTCPAFIYRVMCSHLSEPLSDPLVLYNAVREAVDTLVNASGTLSCNEIDPNPYSHPSLQYDGIWDYQQCTEFQPDSQWFATNGITDMFWPQPYNASFLELHCLAAWNVTVTEQSKTWMTTDFDIPTFRGASNILFSNGAYDGWGSATILTSPDPSRLLISLNISTAAHHLDLMFSHPEDPQSIIDARKIEVEMITTWIELARARTNRKDL
jgi:lysosomal Pro-X carboxypeptidase